MLNVEAIYQPDWKQITTEGCRNVYAKTLIARPAPAIVLLKFEVNGTIHEHPADHDIDVVCLEGAGMVKMGDEVAPIQAGERVRWHAGIPHQLWTTDSTMKTLMIERYSEDDAS